MCLDKIDWDGELQGDARKQWNALISELEFLKTVRVPRCYYLSNQNRLTTQIHGFSDASERAIGAVVYTRTVYENSRVDVKLMASKTRVAPVKKQTIPGLELIGATLLAKLVSSVLSTLEWNVEIFYWVDSMTTLHWIRNGRVLGNNCATSSERNKKSFTCGGLAFLSRILEPGRFALAWHFCAGTFEQLIMV